MIAIWAKQIVLQICLGTSTHYGLRVRSPAVRHGIGAYEYYSPSHHLVDGVCSPGRVCVCPCMRAAGVMVGNPLGGQSRHLVPITTIMGREEASRDFFWTSRLVYARAMVRCELSPYPARMGAHYCVCLVTTDSWRVSSRNATERCPAREGLYFGDYPGTTRYKAQSRAEAAHKVTWIPIRKLG